MTDSKGNTTLAATKTAKFTASATISVKQTSSGYKVTVKNIEAPGTLKSIKYSIWSSKNGQDDIKKYTQSYTSGSSSVSYKNTVFSDYGTYYVKVYGVNSSGKSVLLGTKEYTVSKPSASSVAVKITAATKSKFKVTVKGLTTGLGVKKVQVAVWSSKNGKDDLTWYTATLNSSGNYVVSTNFSKHSYAKGTYNFKVYVTDANGKKTCISTKTAKLTNQYSSFDIKTVTKNVKYTASISDLAVPGGYSKVVYAVWSATDGQDDIKWYTAKKSGSTWSATIKISNHKTEGQYYVHAYAVTSSGKKVYIAANNTLSVETTTTAKITTGNVNNAKGTFDVTISTSNTTPGINTMSVAVWSKNDGKDDIVWYTAEKQSNGTYTFTVSAKDHEYDIGDYYIRAYATFKNGIKKCVAKKTYDFEPSNYTYVVKTKSGSRTVTIKNPTSGAKTISFAVWSKTDGQDDIQWFTAKKQSDGSYKATISLSGYKNSGTYYVHAYMNVGTSTEKYLRQRTFTVKKAEVSKTGWYYEDGYKFYYINGEKQTDVRSIIGKQSTYRIEVNRKCNTVTIYAKDGSNGYIIPVVAFACSVGKSSTPTAKGTYTVGSKYRWKLLMGPSYGQYATAVSGQSGVYFHSVAGVNMTSYNISASDYNMLGSAASHGCIRLNVRDAKWIYDNVPTGSTIYIYDSSTAGPLGKPSTIKIPSTQNWDPTDPAITG